MLGFKIKLEVFLRERENDMQRGVKGRDNLNLIRKRGGKSLGTSRDLQHHNIFVKNCGA